jgi:cytochrome P450
MNEFVTPYIEETLRLSPAELEMHTKSARGYTFLHALAGFTRDRRILRDQLIAILLAGRDTTASTLSWTFYELAKHPEVVAKLRAEIAATVGQITPPTYAHLKTMKYLQNTMNETLRMYPVVPFNVRFALRDTTLPRGGGPDGKAPVGVLKDTAIAFSTILMQRRPDIYPPSFASNPSLAPTNFNPDRWATWQPPSWTYVPFNGGPRICIGQQFALAEMGYTIVRLLQHFIRLENRMSVEICRTPLMKSDIVLSPAAGVHVAFWDAVAAVGKESGGPSK